MVLLLTGNSCLADMIAGDVAILGLRGDEVAGVSEEGFSWVALTNLTAGQELVFTDLGWRSDNSGFFGNEGAISFQVGAGGVAVGTVFQLNFDRTGSGTSSTAYTFQSQSNSTGSALGSYANANIVGELGLLPATTGDNLFVYEGTRATPNFLYGFRTEGGAWQDPAGPGTANDDNDDSALPPSLVNANTALGGPGATTNVDNARYTGITSGTLDDLLTALQDPANWETDNGTGIDGQPSFGADLSNGLIGAGSGFSVVPEPGALTLFCVAALGCCFQRRRP